ncbi:universal stress protein [Roseovarius sp. SCSIO 43702]|uniref:universal stress protein n=1 Tax=Roseovarius sp. SCSIO 43702 TaxID=2823043 RepID=UPI001C7383A5|nr:universal stress protein [Roseovarius sp. SCSIO 43702]QYX56392.1 universal stress protein [Roseovarius sp. SCSIO 43702]
MAFKTLFSVLTDTEMGEDTLPSALALAQTFDAHLDTLCLGLDRTQVANYYAGATSLLMQEAYDRAKDEASRIEQAARKALSRSDARWGCQAEVAQMADLTRIVSLNARFADLAVMPQPYAKGRGAEVEAALEACLFDASVPVLVLPKGSHLTERPRRVLVAWNESAEALRAVKCALPLIEGADQVHVVLVDPPAHGPMRSDPGGLLSQFLARHGHKVEVEVLSKTLPRVADVIARHAGDMDADMLVMGAYGHSRFREAIFGGATRYMLEHAPRPVLMAR